MQSRRRSTRSFWLRALLFRDGEPGGVGGDAEDEVEMVKRREHAGSLVGSGQGRDEPDRVLEAEADAGNDGHEGKPSGEAAQRGEQHAGVGLVAFYRI